MQKRPNWQVTCGVASVLFLSGLPYTTRLGLELLDVVDHYVATLFLLCVVFAEAIMLNFDFGYERLASALKEATKGNKGTPDGRNLFPLWLCRIDFHFTVPVVSGALALYLLQTDIREPYGGYSAGLNGYGWSLFALLVIVSFLTIWKRDPGSLPETDTQGGEELADTSGEELNTPTVEVVSTNTSSSGSEESREKVDCEGTPQGVAAL